ncbi:unnamed protein product [Macrosiphum euphorbiae]|uniref:Uncharacterized protein n=1 Tax=Macrosiphum euphorbiae TaxID=13131 RepID=A0AAV0XC60_9HEMI|nr:unnamed protein product [Macrosiphum euphorbiae]CAI6352407.1 unnamed protein product [Macrosiphum euphorbiae]CAI6355031.1 unnamed protein product [Macrosiphum euphorbiae]CAI6361226.1 unnamed protein product [Macrosiphum euphorbiae]CAI6363132.1 unnamed protein product [Macrosiphum euphorbiae]
MEPQSFNLLSEDYDDMEFIELFGSEYLSLDSEYQREISIQQIEQTTSPIAMKKAQAKYERESAAKLTQYTLEPTFTIPTSVRAKPILNATPAVEIDKSGPSTSAKQILIATPVVEANKTDPHDSNKPMSNNQRKKEQYKQNRRDIRRQRRPHHSTH